MLILNLIDYSKFSFELAIIESYSPADYLETYKKFEPRLIDHGYEFVYEISDQVLLNKINFNLLIIYLLNGEKNVNF